MTLKLCVQVNDVMYTPAHVHTHTHTPLVLSDDLYFLEDGATPSGSRCTGSQRSCGEGGAGTDPSETDIVDLKRAEVSDTVTNILLRNSTTHFHVYHLLLARKS